MLLKRAKAPLAVLLAPVVLLKSAPAPVAVFSTPLPDLGPPRWKERSCPEDRVELPGGFAPERKPTNCRIAMCQW